MGISIPTANAALKIRYARDLSRILMTDPMMEPFMGLTARKKGKTVKSAVGQSFVVPLKTRDQQSANFSFTAAQAKSDGANGASKYDAFLVPVVPGYATGRVDGQAQVVSEGDNNAFVDFIDEETKGALRQAQQEIAMHAFRKGTGSRGQIGALNATSITLTKPGDTTYFEVDQQLSANVADGTGTLRATGPFLITGIDPVLGVLTLSGNPTAGGGPWQINDFLYVTGDFVASTSTKIVGLGGWIPDTAPTGAVAFNGVVRDSNWKLYGLRVAFATDLKTTLHKATGLVRQHARGKTTHCFMNPIDWANFANTLEASRQTFVENKEYNLSYNAINFVGMTGTFPILPDANVPQGKAYLLNLDHIYFIHAGQDLCSIVDEDGNVILRKSDADAYEVRVRSMANLVCDDPSQQLVITGIT